MKNQFIFVPASLLATVQFGAALVIDQVGASTFWDSGSGAGITWTALGGVDAAGDYSVDSGDFDFVGNSSTPGFYCAKTTDYLFFRMRVDTTNFGTSTADSPRGTYALLIDIITNPNPTTPATGIVAPKSGTFTGATGIDYAFAWDSYSTSRAGHGLEMSIAESGGALSSRWSATSLNDIDNMDGSKLTNDINGLVSPGASTYRTGDGYVRTTDNVDTGSGNFGPTSFIDFAVSWNYLETYTLLNRSQQWNVTVATDKGTNDHQFLAGDVYGAGNSENKVLSNATWSSVDFSAVPEPGTALVGLLVAAGLMRRRRN